MNRDATVFSTQERERYFVINVNLIKPFTEATVTTQLLHSYYTVLYSQTPRAADIISTYIA
jgi:hypothetical protein